MRLLKAKTIAEVLDVSEARAYELMREELIPTVRLGRQVRVSADALKEFIANGGRSLPGGWRREPAQPDAA